MKSGHPGQNLWRHTDMNGEEALQVPGTDPQTPGEPIDSP
jgi:hypothetical protein